LAVVPFLVTDAVPLQALLLADQISVVMRAFMG